jgi:outer membrane protein assembly factor BamB
LGIVDEVVYGLDDGILAAINLSSGEKLWKKDRIGHGQLLLVGGKILAITESGDLQLIAINPKGSTRVGILPGALEGKTWNHMALATPYLLIRNDHEAACYLLETEPRNGSSSPSNDKTSP